MKQSAEILERILVLTPTGNDAANTIDVLRHAGLTGVICQNVQELARNSGEGAGALLVAEEAFTPESAACLVEVLSRQPQWSDIPVLMITSARATAKAGQDVLNFFAPHGNVTLVERPVRPISLVSALQAALRARRRQYLLRKFVEEEAATRARLELAMEAGQLGHWDLDLKTRTATRSLRHDQIFGYKTLLPTWGFEKFLEHIHPDDRAVVDQMFQKSIAGFAPWEFECRILRADGTSGWIWVRGICISDANGTPTRVLGVVADITERKNAFETLAEKERRFRAVFNQQFQFMVLLTPEGSVMEINDLPLRATGISRDRMIGKIFWETPLWTNLPEMKKAWPERLKQAAVANAPVLSVDIFEAAGGEIRTADAAITAVKDAGGRVEFYIVQASDITERKRAEDELRTSEERFRALADNIPQLAWMTDATGGIVWYNQRWFDYTGTTLEEMPGNGWESVHHPEHYARVSAGWNHCLQSGEPWEDTFPLRGRDGEYRWFLSRAFPIRDAEGHIARWFGTNTDVTELRETQRALRKLKEELQQHASNLEQTVAERTAKLQETISELEAFSYSVSHDLRAPLRAMQGYSQFLLEDYADKIDPTGRDYITRIVKAAERLDRLVTDILTYSRISRGKIQNRAIDLEKLIEDVVHGYPTLQPDRADIEVQPPLLKVLGHEGSLTQCISNLLGNAVKFVQEGKKPRVLIWTEKRGDHVRIFFKDNGVGISPEHQQRIFQMFEKAPHPKTYEGTGIGLAIVRKAVERMGGDAGVQSEPGQGSSFWIDLPQAS